MHQITLYMEEPELLSGISINFLQHKMNMI